MARHQTGKGTKLAARCQANPGRAVRVRTPDAAAPVRSMPGWDARMRPGPAAALGGRARCRPRPPRGEASWTSPHALCSQHRYEQVSSPSRAAQLVRSLPLSLPRHHGRGTQRGTRSVSHPAALVCCGRAACDRGLAIRPDGTAHRWVRGVVPLEGNRGARVVPNYASAASAVFASGVEGSGVEGSGVEDRGAGAAAPMAPSERMSIRHPVSRAASRAFCPSLPMASESW